METQPKDRDDSVVTHACSLSMSFFRFEISWCQTSVFFWKTRWFQFRGDTWLVFQDSSHVVPYHINIFTLWCQWTHVPQWSKGRNVWVIMTYVTMHTSLHPRIHPPIRPSVPSYLPTHRLTYRQYIHATLLDMSDTYLYTCVICIHAAILCQGSSVQVVCYNMLHTQKHLNGFISRYTTSVMTIIGRVLLGLYKTRDKAIAARAYQKYVRHRVDVHSYDRADIMQSHPYCSSLSHHHCFRPVSCLHTESQILFSVSTHIQDFHSAPNI